VKQCKHTALSTDSTSQHGAQGAACWLQAPAYTSKCHRNSGARSNLTGKQSGMQRGWHEGILTNYQRSYRKSREKKKYLFCLQCTHTNTVHKNVAQCAFLLQKSLSSRAELHSAGTALQHRPHLQEAIPGSAVLQVGAVRAGSPCLMNHTHRVSPHLSEHQWLWAQSPPHYGPGATDHSSIKSQSSVALQRKTTRHSFTLCPQDEAAPPEDYTHGITALLRLEKTLKIIKSNHNLTILP